jgi:predicted PurR-regulated permease PerM
VLLFLPVIHHIDNNVLAPRGSGDAVGCTAGAMFALLAGFQLASLLGALFAVPLWQAG